MTSRLIVTWVGGRVGECGGGLYRYIRTEVGLNPSLPSILFLKSEYGQSAETVMCGSGL